MGRKGKHPPVRGTPKVDKRSKVRRKQFAAKNEGQRSKGPKRHSMVGANFIIGPNFFKKRKKKKK